MKITCKRCHTRFDVKDKYCPYCYEKAIRSVPIGTTDQISRARTYSRSDLKQFDKTKIVRKATVNKNKNIVILLGCLTVFVFLVALVIISFLLYF